MSINRVINSLQDPYIFDPNCQMKVDEYGFFITWKSEGKVQSFNELLSIWHLKSKSGLAHTV